MGCSSVAHEDASAYFDPDPVYYNATKTRFVSTKSNPSMSAKSEASLKDVEGLKYPGSRISIVYSAGNDFNKLGWCVIRWKNLAFQSAKRLETRDFVGSRGGAVGRVLASRTASCHNACGLNFLLVLHLAWGFSQDNTVFTSPRKPTFPNSYSIKLKSNELRKVRSFHRYLISEIMINHDRATHEEPSNVLVKNQL